MRRKWLECLLSKVASYIALYDTFSIIYSTALAGLMLLFLSWVRCTLPVGCDEMVQCQNAIHSNAAPPYAMCNESNPTSARLLLYATRSPSASNPSRQRPRHAHYDFAFAETPEIHAHADDVVETRVRALV